MAIEILERGMLAEDKPYEAICNRCRSRLRFLRGDAKFTDDQRDGVFLTITCPVCGDLVHRQAKP